MARLILIRHGQAMYGHADFDRLSPRGQDQARAVGRHLAGARIDAVYRGPLRRQIETAALAAEGAGGALPEPRELAELAEYPGVELAKHFLPRLAAEQAQLGASPVPAGSAFQTVLARWSRDEWTAEGVERVGEFAARVRAGLDRVIRDLRSGATVAVVTSAGPIGVAVGLVFGASELHMLRASIVVRNASITELVVRTREFAWHPERVTLLGFNSTSHLPAELVTEY